MRDLVRKERPDPKYAVCDARYVTIVKGKRHIQKYRSGEKLVGRIPNRKDGML